MSSWLGKEAREWGGGGVLGGGRTVRYNDIVLLLIWITSCKVMIGLVCVLGVVMTNRCEVWYERKEL